MTVKWLLPGLTMLLCFSPAGGLWAATEGDTTTITVSGTLVEPPVCTLNGDKPLYVSFGDSIGIKKIVSGIYRKPVEPSLECDDSSLGWQMTLTVTGIAAGFDPDKATVVSAEQANLGVKLYAGGAPFTLDTPLKINGQTLPQIEAVLVKREDATLDDGKFTANATLRVELN